ncbi:MAG: hypothetical protein ABL877_04045 [Thiobacillus sp.]
MIVIGLGSGRTGTASLAHLLDSQPAALCFHELNPTGAVFRGNPQSALNTINEFQAILNGGPKHLLAIDYARPASVKTYGKLQDMPAVRILGDIAFYYLNYVDDILAINRQVKFVCIKRDKQQTVDSWLQKSALKRWRSLWLGDRFKALITRTPFNTEYNYWMEHDGTRWQLDPVWDKTFPKFTAPSKRDAIEQYWDYYYQEADRLKLKHPDNFRIFDIEKMSHPDGQREILSFIGLADSDMVLKEKFHLHKSRGD